MDLLGQGPECSCAEAKQPASMNRPRGGTPSNRARHYRLSRYHPPGPKIHQVFLLLSAFTSVLNWRVMVNCPLLDAPDKINEVGCAASLPSPTHAHKSHH